MDLGAFGWNTPRTQYWELRSDDKISDFAYAYSDYSRLPGGREWSQDAVGFRFDDEAAHSDFDSENTGLIGSCGEAEEYYDLGRVGVKLNPKGDHRQEEREVYAAYEHTWSKSTSNLGVGFGASPAGPVVTNRLSPEEKVKSISTTTTLDRDTVLKISQDEMNHHCC